TVACADRGAPRAAPAAPNVILTEALLPAQVAEGPFLPPPAGQVGNGQRRSFSASRRRHAVPRYHQALGLLEWERFEKHPVDDTEDRRDRTDSERERENGN